jgi:hypothetical protein
MTEKEADEQDHAIDMIHCSSRWVCDAVENGWPLADFECKHDRLPGDKTPLCGCWPEELI